ncbi:RDD family protein [Cohnella sp. NL03-T5]|uniref:RDD family protein n=2 Tax=Cohnella silvisoli TaxID=2873699 RepID=A0ABV1KN27_9BACL|nr:RDD family protein [Cohnella silvisoli]MCD9020236.1 RDD family protein [Cohnella silvisoli]
MGSITSTYGASIFFRRWAATVIDFLIWAGLIGLIAASEEFGDDYLTLAMLGWIVGFVSYYLLLEGLTGYTLGKFVLRIQAVNETGGVPGFVKSLIRTVLRLVDTNPLLIGGLPAGICVLVTPKKQRLGDMVAKTYVVKVRDLVTASRSKTIILAVVFSILACVSVVSAVSGISALIRESNKSEVYISKDKQFQITAPSSWSNDSDLHQDADISISNRYAEKYFIVLSESKQGFDDGTTLADYEKIVEEHFVAEMGHKEFVMDPHHTEINGNPAIQFSFHITVDEFPATYLVTVVETQSHFHQLLAWTLKDKYSSLQVELSNITVSFREAVGNESNSGGGSVSA